MSEKLAVFGGTFDPVHLAHLRAALEAAEEIGLDRVLFMPCAVPPTGKTVVASPAQRLHMLRLATADNPRFGVTDLEIRLGGTSYTVNTLARLAAEHPGARVYFLIGADAFFHLHTWYQPLKLFHYADFVVMARPRSPHAELLEYMQRRLHPDFALSHQGWVRLHGGGGAKWVPTTLLNISSTAIRRRAKAGLSLTYLVHPAVEEYINRMELYRDPAASAESHARRGAVRHP